MTNGYDVQLIATCISALICALWIYKTDGKDGGLGWFILSLLFIWGG